MSYTKTNWENLPSTNTPINETNLNKIENQLENSQEQIDNIIEYEDVNISLTTKAGDYVWKSATFSVPAGYKVLSASIIDNDYVSEMVTSIIALRNNTVAVNAYCKSVQTRTVVVRVLFIKI